jgi:phytoene dehydrogenase-like protein
VHDLYAGYLILFALSQANADFGADLQARGLQMIPTSRPAGVSMPGGKAAAITTDMAANIAETERLAPGDGQGWTTMIQTIGQYAPQVFSLLKMDLTTGASAELMQQLMVGADQKTPSFFAGDFLLSARDVLESLFKSDTWQGILAPWVFHSGHGPEDANSGFWTYIFALGLQSAGQFVAQGGTEMLARALVQLVQDQGGKVQCNTTVSQILVEGGKAVGVRTEAGEEYRAKWAVIATANPDDLYLKLLSDTDVPSEIKRQASKFRYGHSVFFVHLALSEPLRWHDDRLNDVAYTHINDGIDGVSKNFNETVRRLLPSDPVIGVGMPTLLDPTRAPEGKAVGVLQVLDVPYRFKGDAMGQIDVGEGVWSDDVKNRFADRVIDIASQHIPNLKDAILERYILTPAQIANDNPNWKYGDPFSGSHDIAQSYLLRPLAGQSGHRTVIPNLYMIGAATHPGLGLGGTSGYIVAQNLLQTG